MANGQSETPAPATADEALRVAGLNLRSLFDRFPFAVQVFSPDGRAIYRNAAHTEMWGPRDENVHAQAIFESPQLIALGLMPYIRRGFSGETVMLPVTRYTTAEEPRLRGGRPIWVRTFIYPVNDETGVMRAVVVMHIDVTEREAAKQLLEERVEERTRELATLLKVSQSAASTLDLDALLRVILDQLKTVAGYTGSAVIVVEGDHFRLIDDRGGEAPDQPNPDLIGTTWPLSRHGAIWETIDRQEPVIIDDVRGESELARAFREVTRRFAETPAIRHVRSWLAVPLVVNDRAIGFISISKDEPGYYTAHHARLAMAIAAHAASAIENARLYEEERRTAEEMTTLLEISRAVSSTLELEPLLGLILDQIKLVVDYTSAVLITIDGEEVRTREYRGPLPREVVLSRPVQLQATPDAEAKFDRGEPFVIADVWGPDEQARLYREQMGEDYLRTTASYLRCLLVAPLHTKGRLIGALALTHHTAGYFTERQMALVQAIANQVAATVDNARLFEQQRQTAKEMASLVEVSRNLSSTLELRPLLELILDQTKVVADYDGASIILIEDSVLRTFIRRAPTDVSADEEHLLRIPLERVRPIADTVFLRRPVIIGDVRGDEPMALAYRAAMGVSLEQTHLRYVRAWMGVPLALKDRVIGMLVLSRTQPHSYTPHHAELVSAIAAQASAAIENARLYEQAHKVAALEERQRLARELHDSVSQVLFSIGLGARTTRTLLERGDPAKAAPSVEYILNLAEMGMAEMRALLFELRPESLEQEGLVAALTKQAAVLRARHGIEVETALATEPEAPLEVKQALYRIGQEAMHNTVKHARASRVDLRLDCRPEGLVLEVRDNGHGFDASASFPGHLGLRSMRERVLRLGGTLAIDSAPGQGACIRATIPTPR
jgi:PAS domain S-box-containing protein